MKDGQVRYGLVCNEAGGILDDILVYRWPYGYAMVVNASQPREDRRAGSNEHAGRLDVEIQDQTLDTAMIAVQGPKAVETVSPGCSRPTPSSSSITSPRRRRYTGKGCVVSRTGYTGEDGFEIMVPNALGVALWDELIGRGAPCRAASGPATRCGSKPRCRSTATS